MPDPTPTPIEGFPTPGDLEAWATATVIKTTTHRNGAAVLGPLRDLGTRALRGLPFTFHRQGLDPHNPSTTVVHGTISGVWLSVSLDSRSIFLMVDFVVGSPIIITYTQRGTWSSGWVVSDHMQARDGSISGTLEIG